MILNSIVHRCWKFAQQITFNLALYFFVKWACFAQSAPQVLYFVWKDRHETYQISNFKFLLQDLKYLSDVFLEVFERGSYCFFNTDFVVESLQLNNL